MMKVCFHFWLKYYLFTFSELYLSGLLLYDARIPIVSIFI